MIRGAPDVSGTTLAVLWGLVALVVAGYFLASAWEAYRFRRIALRADAAVRRNEDRIAAELAAGVHPALIKRWI